ncbi:MAG: Rrf2 family transcriptional regulator [Epulopiscium sp.]|nr:Rrf2 family transcriptional regulator [Candidatus Epulonipiscium sp.]
MKLSTKGRYGLKIMLDLAINGQNGHIALNSIAERQGLSEHYLEQLIAVLRKAGLVQSMRGAQGGYILAKPLDEITIGDILRTLEGSLAPVDCVIEDQEIDCDKSEFCVTKTVWMKVRDSINEVVDNITLEDLVEDYNKIHDQAVDMYYI